MADTKKKLRPSMLFLTGAVSLLGLYLEYALLAAERFIFDKSYNEFTITESVTHWIVTCVVWGFLGLIIFYVASRVYGFDLTKKDRRPTVRGLVVALLLLSSSVGVKYLLLGGWQMTLDFKQQGWFQFIFLNVYRLFEAVLLVFAAVFFQEACQRVTKIENEHIPWGGALLALTWGLLHFLTSGDIIMAIFYTALAFFIGCAHLAAKKNLYISYLFAAVLILL